MTGLSQENFGGVGNDGYLTNVEPSLRISDAAKFSSRDTVLKKSLKYWSLAETTMTPSKLASAVDRRRLMSKDEACVGGSACFCPTKMPASRSFCATKASRLDASVGSADSGVRSPVFARKHR
jgi:hypothetical protein